jgi:hypothetical protein
MEAAGVDINSSCLVIRGISNYADSHKSDMWRSYAAGKAVVFARELLDKIPPADVKEKMVSGQFTFFHPEAMVTEVEDASRQTGSVPQTLLEGPITVETPKGLRG